MLGVLERQGMEAEDVAEDRKILLGGLMEVDPEEGAAREQTLRAVTGERHLSDVIDMSNMARRSCGSAALDHAVCRSAAGRIVIHLRDRTGEDRRNTPTTA